MVPILLLLSLTSATALDLSGAGFTVVSETREGERTAYTARDEEGNELIVVAKGRITDRHVAAVVQARDTFFSWRFMEISYLRIIVDEATPQVLIIPGVFEYDGLNLVPFLPSGLQFFLDDRLEYDFRIKAQNMFVRMKGQFFDEEQFSIRLVSAARDPGDFIARNDPEYYFRKFQDIDAQLAAVDDRYRKFLESLYGTFSDYEEFVQGGSVLLNDYRETKRGIQTLSDAHQAVQSQVEDLRRDHHALLEDYTALKQAAAGLVAEYRATKADHELLRSEHEALTSAHEALLEEHDSLQVSHDELTAREEATAKALDTLRYAFLTQSNTGLFRGPSPVDPTVISRVLEEKRKNPDATAKEIAAALKIQDLKVTLRVVRLIIRAYLGVETD